MMMRAVLGLFVMGATIVSAQSGGPVSDAAVRSFEVASIKQSPPPGTGFTRLQAGPMPGGRWVAQNASFRMILQAAYPGFSQQAQIVGGPDWMTSTRFDITAVAGGEPPTSEQMTTMLRQLLAERFALKVHVEPRELDVYALVLARSDGRLGPSLRKAAVDCQALAEARKRGDAPPPPPPARGERPQCGMSTSITASGLQRLATGGTPITTIASTVQSTVGRPVLDRTGLSGTFDVDLEFAREAGLLIRPATEPTADSLPSVFTALQEQLGLKLEPRKETMDVLVIDRVEMPTPD
jgi:uncharacterized protein (TIGR03435 family)